MEFLAESYYFLVIRNFGDSGMNKVPIITSTPTLSPNIIAKVVHSLDIFQKYMTSNTGIDVSTMFNMVPLGTCHLLGKSSIKYRNPSAREPTQHIPRMNMSAVVKAIEWEKFMPIIAPV